MQPMKKQAGLTLIELMVSTIILALLMAVALPSMKSMLDRGNFKPIGRSFEKAVKYARSEAINRSQTVRISPLDGSSDWSKGWRIDAITQANPLVLTLIRTFDEIPGDSIFTSDTFDGDTFFDILPNGQAALIGNFTLSPANCSGGKTYTYSILLSGIIDRSESPCN